jgi:hypothetical protein
VPAPIEPLGAVKPTTSSKKSPPWRDDWTVLGVPETSVSSPPGATLPLGTT